MRFFFCFWSGLISLVYAKKNRHRSGNLRSGNGRQRDRYRGRRRRAHSRDSGRRRSCTAQPRPRVEGADTRGSGAMFLYIDLQGAAMEAAAAGDTTNREDTGMAACRLHTHQRLRARGKAICLGSHHDSSIRGSSNHINNIHSNSNSNITLLHHRKRHKHAADPIPSRRCSRKSHRPERYSIILQHPNLIGRMIHQATRRGAADLCVHKIPTKRSAWLFFSFSLFFLGSIGLQPCYRKETRQSESHQKPSHTGNKKHESAPDQYREAVNHFGVEMPFQESRLAFCQGHPWGLSRKAANRGVGADGANLLFLGR